MTRQYMFTSHLQKKYWVQNESEPHPLFCTVRPVHQIWKPAAGVGYVIFLQHLAVLLRDLT